MHKKGALRTAVVVGRKIPATRKETGTTKASETLFGQVFFFCFIFRSSAFFVLYVIDICFCL